MSVLSQAELADRRGAAPNGMRLASPTATVLWLLAFLLVAVALNAAVVGFGHLVLALADMPAPLAAAYLVGIALLGFPLYAACVIAQARFTRQRRP